MTEEMKVRAVIALLNYRIYDKDRVSCFEKIFVVKNKLFYIYRPAVRYLREACGPKDKLEVVTLEEALQISGKKIGKQVKFINQDGNLFRDLIHVPKLMDAHNEKVLREPHNEKLLEEESMFLPI